MNVLALTEAPEIDRNVVVAGLGNSSDEASNDVVGEIIVSGRM